MKTQDIEAAHRSPEAPAGGTRTGAKLHAVIAFVAICFICVVWGGMAVLAGFFPGRQLRHAYDGACALKTRIDYDTMTYSKDLWSSNRFPCGGVTLCKRERVSAGYTLYTSGHTQGAFLIDLDGNVVHEWNLPYDRIWDKTDAVKDPRPANQTFWFKAHVFPNGDLMAVVEGNGSTPWGQGIIKMDQNSKLIWKFLENAHHDFSIGDDGRIYCLTHRTRTTPVAGLTLDYPCLEDSVVVLSHDGKKLDELSMFDAFAHSRFALQLNVGSSKTAFGEYLHCNAARVVNKDLAPLFPFAQEGQVCVSMCHFQSSICVVDIPTRRVVWLKMGSWRYQHDPEFLDNGHMMLFDNWGNLESGGISRAIEFDPITGGVVWSYHGTPDDLFASEKRGCTQRLPNGNTLINESDAGRIFEVTHDGDIAWEFVNPVRAGKSGELIPVIGFAMRLSPDELEPSFRASLVSKQPKPGAAL